MSEEEARKLLAEVRRASEAARASRRQADADSASRREAVKAAMTAGLPRQAIAEAAGTAVNNLYRITR